MDRYSRYETADAMCLGMVTDCLMHGTLVESRRYKAWDICGWSGVLADPRARVVRNPGRGLREGYPAASVAWNLAMRDDVESICWWNPNGRKISDDGQTFYGANYGQRWNGYLKEAIELVRRDPGTRRAWVPIWQSYDLLEYDTRNDTTRTYSRDGLDVPCTLGFGIRCREPGKLSMNVAMRSQSAWAVFPYDVYLFSVLQELIANELEMQLGDLSWMCSSVHVYEREMEWVQMGMDTAVRFSTEPMRKISLNLSNAIVAYPEAMERAMLDPEAGTAGLPDDPIVEELFRGAKEVWAAEQQ